jgi:hypothetical protein
MEKPHGSRFQQIHLRIASHRPAVAVIFVEALSGSKLATILTGVDPFRNAKLGSLKD